MKKILLASAILALTASVASAQFAGPTATTPRAGVLNSVHDMRGYTTGVTDTTVGGIDQQRVCAFCHTPHHALADTGNGPAPIEYLPLWSHEINTLTFNGYQSTTLQSTAYGSDILVGPSRLCMSCHDGTVAIDTHYTQSGSSKLTNDQFNNPGVGWGANGGGGDLTNDHPVGFDYNAVAGATTQDTPVAMTSTSDGYINPSSVQFKNRPSGAPAVTIADRLYKPLGTSTVGIMTCATCHDVHNRKNGDEAIGINYLVMAPQRDSSLCLTCHIK
jgi:hypothetical protein